jgi:hypothetical protein
MRTQQRKGGTGPYRFERSTPNPTDTHREWHRQSREASRSHCLLFPALGERLHFPISRALESLLSYIVAVTANEVTALAGEVESALHLPVRWPAESTYSSMPAWSTLSSLSPIGRAEVESSQRPVLTAHEEITPKRRNRNFRIAHKNEAAGAADAELCHTETAWARKVPIIGFAS